MSVLHLCGQAPLHPWTLEPEGPPAVARRCPRCDQPRPFVSSQRFRVNGNGRRLDVWLIYNCAICSASWNLTVARRVRPADLGPDLVRYERNDRDLALRVAFDPVLLAGAGVRAEPVGWRVVGPEPRPPCVVQIECPWPGAPRLDRVLADGLALSRSEVVRRARRGDLALLPAHEPRLLRRPVRDGQRVHVS